MTYMWDEPPDDPKYCGNCEHIIYPPAPCSMGICNKKTKIISSTISEDDLVWAFEYDDPCKYWREA